MLDEHREGDQSSVQDKGIIEEASKEGLGIVVSKYNEKAGLGQERVVNLWIRRQSPNINLAILVALQLEGNWQGTVRLIQAVDKDQEREEARAYLSKLKNLMRMSPEGDTEIMVGHFMDCLKNAPPADINIFGMGEDPDIAMIHEVAKAVQTPILFLRDSKHESALA
jgi:predicted SnoaL-like aldol condensation-catalyzing enzyme